MGWDGETEQQIYENGNLSKNLTIWKIRAEK